MRVVVAAPCCATRGGWPFPPFLLSGNNVSLIAMMYVFGVARWNGSRHGVTRRGGWGVTKRRY